MTLIPIMLVAALAMMSFELLRPAWRRPMDGGWIFRAVAFNALQAAVALVGAMTWDTWFNGVSVVERGTLSGAPAILIGYLLVTFVYYWWHRARHVSAPLWRFLHGVHHSPSRIEILTSFYKHPAELVLNGLLTSALLYFVLGLDPVIVSAVVLVTGLAELFYHWNVSTPRWLGWFFQRPEMHRVHHARGLHTCNFSDLPLWDAMFGTLHNPRDDVEQCGFPDEARVVRLLLGQPVREL